MHEHVNDPYVQRAQKDGYRARAAYKLLEINEKDKLIKSGAENLAETADARCRSPSGPRAGRRWVFPQRARQLVASRRQTRRPVGSSVRPRHPAHGAH